MLAKSVVNRPTTVAILFALLVALGLFASTRLAIDLLPEINPPVLLVVTNYTGSGPEEIEASITRPLEGLLSSVGHIEKVSSTSTTGNSMIQLNFTYGTNMADASSDVRQMLEMSKNLLPSDADAPVVYKFDPSMWPILTLSVNGNRSPEELRDIAENNIEPRLEQVDGVSRAAVSGGRTKAILVQIPQNRLEAFELNLTQVSAILRGMNVQISGGQIDEGNLTYLVQTSGQYKTIGQILDTVVATKGPPGNQKVIRVRDIAQVVDGYKPAEGFVRINGKPGVLIQVQKQSGMNSVATADGVMARIPKILKELPAGINIEVTQDNTKIIRASLRDVTEAGAYGIILAIFVLMIFLRSAKSTLVISLSIPISVIITLAAMYFLHLTLNIMTLAGLTLGIGRLLDDSIVVLENIFRYREKGAKLKPAAINGSSEMLVAILASTFTTISVFAPLIMFRSGLEVIGELFSGIAFTIVISLVSSLLVAMILVPVLTSKYIKLYTRLQRPLVGPFKWTDDVLARFFQNFDSAYKRLLRFVLRHRAWTIVTVIAVLGVSLAIIPRLGFEFMPSQNEDAVQVSVTMPVGTRLGVTDAVVNQLEEIAKSEIKGYENIIVNVGGKSFFGLGGVSTNTATLTVTLPEYKKRIDKAATIKTKLRKHFNDFPSATFAFVAQQGMGGSSTPIDIQIKTDDLELGRKTALTIRDLLKAHVPEVTEPVADTKDGQPQIEVAIDRDRAQALGINLSAVGQEIRASIDGLTSGRITRNGRDTDIVVILDPKDRVVSTDLERIFVNSPIAGRVALANIAKAPDKTSGPTAIQRLNSNRIFHVTGGLAPGVKLNEVMAKIDLQVKQNIPMDENLIIAYSGDFESLMKYGSMLIFIVIVSIMLVYGIMAAQFESFLDPFIILFTMPLTIIGIVFVSLLGGEPLSVFTAVGMLMLVGIVTNNGIVMLSYTNTLRKRGLPLLEAMVESGGHRLRPILMTALSFILALIPVAWFSSEGATMIKPIAKTLVGGMTASTVLMLIFVPTLYVIFHTRKEKSEGKKRAREEARILAARASLASSHSGGKPTVKKFGAPDVQSEGDE